MSNAFENPCTCGGYAPSMSGRDPESPHMTWCPRYEEFLAWRAEQKGTASE